MKFKKGVSGNALGRPKAQVTAQQLRASIAANLPALLTVVTEKALAGDMAAIKLLMDRALPALKPHSEPVAFTVAATDTIVTMGQGVIEALARGDISAEQGSALLSALASQAKIKALTPAVVLPADKASSITLDHLNKITERINAKAAAEKAQAALNSTIEI